MLPLHSTLLSMLANIIGDWNSEVAVSKAYLSAHLPRTTRLLDILRTVRLRVLNSWLMRTQAELLPAPLCNVGEVLFGTSPREVVSSLMCLWAFLKENVATTVRFSS